jgi:hypothetical protein
VGDQHSLAQARFDRRGGVAHVDHKRAAADRGAVDPFGGKAEIMGDRHRRLAGGRDAVDVGRFEPAVDVSYKRLFNNKNSLPYCHNPAIYTFNANLTRTSSAQS